MLFALDWEEGMTRTLRRGFELWAALVASGCAAADQRPAQTAQATIVDSAGLSIVTSPESPPDTLMYRVAVSPTVIIGNDDSRPEPYLFGYVVDALVLEDGSILVADGQTGEVRLFSSSGEYVRRIGGKGRGPGEFRGVRSLDAIGDTIIVISVYDGDPVSMFRADGTFLRSFSLDPVPNGIPIVEGAWSDGTLFVRASRQRNPRFKAPDLQVPTLIMNEEQLLRLDAEGNVSADFGTHVTERSVFYNNHPRSGFEVTAPSYLPQPSWITTSSGLFVTQAETFEIRSYALDGTLKRIIRKAHSPSPISREWADSTWKATLAMFEGSVEWLKRVDPPTVPLHAPAIDRLLAGPQKTLWARSHSPSDSDIPLWFVFDSTGVVRHSLRTRVVPVQVGADFVLALEQMEDGVWVVAVYPLSKADGRN